MPHWQRIAAYLANNAETTVDALRERMGRCLGCDEPLQIVPYRGYGFANRVYLHGRVLEDKGVGLSQADDKLWNNLVNMYKRFQSNELPGARVRARIAGADHEVVADHEGYFDLQLELPAPLPEDRLWHTIELELVEPHCDRPIRATGQIVVPLAHAQFGVISDIDDTVIHTGATSLLRMARTVFLANARTRLPFEGVAGLYRALHAGTRTEGTNPIFYVSSSPWNLYDMLAEFLELQRIPAGPMFLRDWGISETQVLPTDHRSHKLEAIRRVLDCFPDLPFLLIGDSGQEDPEIYHEVVHNYPDRILAVYIRNVAREPERLDAIRGLAQEVVEAGSTLLLADDSLAVARHAVEQGWVRPEALSEVAADKAADEAPPSVIETLLGEAETEEGPTVVITDQPAGAGAVVGGAVEEALQTGDEQQETPTVIVEGERK